jgi:hypothetical protein
LFENHSILELLFKTDQIFAIIEVIITNLKEHREGSMRNFSYRLFAFLLTVLLVTQACLFFSGGEEATSPTDMPTTSPTRVATVPSVTQAEHKPEEDVDQEDLVYELSTESALVWALVARASSNEGEGAYQTSQALGERDTLICGDFVTA